MSNVSAVDTLLRTLGDERRCEIIRLVWIDELPATQIAEHFPDVTRSAISQHLGVLRRHGLVNERREGTRRLYSANQAEIARLREFLDSFWSSGLDRLRNLAEAADDMKGA
jgi:DNA-binding transcriptional ArsR family regulator